MEITFLLQVVEPTTVNYTAVVGNVDNLVQNAGVQEVVQLTVSAGSVMNAGEGNGAVSLVVMYNNIFCL